MKRIMSNKSTILAALLCLSSINPANAASVWSTELLLDDLSSTPEWRLHVVSDGDGLMGPASITGVYIDYIDINNVFNSQIAPFDLLTSSLADVASNDPYDFVSNAPVTSVVQSVGLDEVIFTQLNTSGSQLVNLGLDGLPVQEGLTCLPYQCITNLHHPDDRKLAVIKLPGDPAPQMTLTRSALSPVPVPAAVWLFGSGLIGLVGIARRKKA